MNESGLISEGFLKVLQRRGEQAQESMRALRAHVCPTCAPDSDEARRCTSRGDAAPFEGEPMCRWAARDAAERRQRELTTDRLERLLTAGCTEPHIRRVVPPARLGQPPLPELTTVPPALRQALLEGPHTAVECAERFTLDRGLLTLLLKGGNGVGKSVAAAHAVASEGRSSCWIQATLWDSFDRIHETGERAEYADLLVVDELGTDHVATVPGCGSAALMDLLLRRRNSGRRTVLTTNLTTEQLLARYDTRWFDRLDQDGLVVECGQLSLRPYLRE